MVKGYWIGRIDVQDMDAYKQYIAANAAAFEKYGARFVVRGGNFKCVEGNSRSRNVVIEFPSYQAALDCYHSDEYAAAKAYRLPASDGDLIIIEGWAG